MANCPVCGTANSACVPAGYVPIPDALITGMPVSGSKSPNTAVPKAADKSRAPQATKAVMKRAVADKSSASTADKSADLGEEQDGN